MSNTADQAATEMEVEVEQDATTEQQSSTKEEADDDIDIDSDADNDAILASNAAPRTSATSSSSPYSSSSSSSASTMSAMDRLNALLLQTEQFSTFAKRDTTNASAAKQAASTRSHQTDKEKEEDSELVADELDEEEHTQPHFTRLTTQPSSVVGEMRDYQLEALNWLIRLHEQNINGILADEMGLGNPNTHNTPQAALNHTTHRTLPRLFVVSHTGPSLFVPFRPTAQARRSSHCPCCPTSKPTATTPAHT